MNLIKNGTVLLAALSVLAMTSCNSNSAKKITFDEAVNWIKNHYDENEKTRKNGTYKFAWDFSKTTDEEAQEFAKNFIEKSTRIDNPKLKDKAEREFGEKDDENALNDANFKKQFEEYADVAKITSTDKTLFIAIEGMKTGEESPIMDVSMKLDDKCFPIFQKTVMNNSEIPESATITGYFQQTVVYSK